MMFAPITSVHPHRVISEDMVTVFSDTDSSSSSPFGLVITVILF